jgi:hypothetical protein
MKTLVVSAAVAALSSTVYAAENPITVTCKGTYEARNPILGERKDSDAEFKFILDTNKKTTTLDLGTGIKGADKDVMRITRITDTRIEFGGEMKRKGGNSRVEFDKTTGTLTMSLFFTSNGHGEPAGEYAMNMNLACTKWWQTETAPAPSNLLPRTQLALLLMQ